MNQDKLRILTMIEEGKLSAKEAAQLLDAIGSENSNLDEGNSEASSFRIKITNTETTEEKINLVLPIGLVKFLYKFIPKKAVISIENKGYSIKDILADVESGKVGTIFEVTDEKEHIELIIE